MNALTFTVRLLEPVLIADIAGGDENSARGYDYIPGSVLRGALIGRYLGGRAADAADAELRRLFFDGAVRYLNAYPFRDGQRFLPVPLSWYTEKDVEAGPVFDRSAGDEDDELPPSIKTLGESFCRLPSEEDAESATVYLDKVARQVDVHIFRSDNPAGPKGNSAVFRYDAIAAGERLAGAILADDARDLDRLRPLVDGELRIGKSRTAGYGRVAFEAVATAGDWREYPAADWDDGVLVVTLLSDALIRNGEGTYAASLEPIIGDPPDRVYARTHLVGGFNRTWGLPLPQAMAIAAGSVFVYGYQENLRERLQVVEGTGIGERRAEGFGRIGVNWHCSSSLRRCRLHREPASAAMTLTGASAEIAGRMAARMWRDRLDRALTAAAQAGAIPTPLPSNAQLSRLRIVCRQAIIDRKLDCVTEHINSLKGAARRQFEVARLGGQPLDEWIRALASRPQSVWAKLSIDESRPPTVGDQKPRADELAPEYAARLIEAIARRAAKERAND